MTKAKKNDKLEQQVAELTADLQRTRADFENFRKRAELDKQASVKIGESKAIMKLLPVIDTVERATLHVPAELKDDAWVKGVTNLSSSLMKSLSSIGLQRIDSSEGATFNPELHEAIQVDEDAEGEKEVIAEELQAGYLLEGRPIRHAMVKVTRK